MSQFRNQQEAEAAGVFISKIKSYVKREGRITKAQQSAIDRNWPTMGLSHSQGRCDFSAIFSNQNPVVLEIGFGMGTSLVEMAKNAPELNFIGIEVHRPGVGACLQYAEEAQVSNLRVYEHDAVEVLADCIPNDSLFRVQLYFPDPWHKKRHHKRRLVQSEFVQKLRDKLYINGQFHMATDWEHYAEHMLEVMSSAAGYTNTATNNTYVEKPDYRPLTKFEQRGQRLGHGVWDLIFTKSA
jgi:tRNA (guanine-N7-)-methyltransferase